MSFVQDGRLYHTSHRRVRLRDFSIPRFLLIASVVATLFVTNPANKQYLNFMNLKDVHKIPRGRGSSSSSSGSGYSTNTRRRDKDEYTTRIASEWLGIEINIKSPKLEWLTSTLSSASSSSSKKKYSNYMLFSLSKHFNGVDLHMLLLQIPLCTYAKHGVLCEWIVDNFYQETKMWDPNNRPFTAMRLVQIVKLISYTLQSCYMPQGRRGPAIPSAVISETMILWPQAGSTMIASFLSTLYQPRFFTDFIPFHLFLHPALVLLDRIILAGTSTQSQASFEFYACVLGLLWFVPALSNHIAFLFTNEHHIRGMKGALASALGYCCAAKPNLILFELKFLGMEWTSGDLWFHAFVLSAAMNLLGLRSSNLGPLSILGPGHWRMSDCIAWAVGGMIGFSLCTLQLDQYNLWWWSFY